LSVALYFVGNVPDFDLANRRRAPAPRIAPGVEVVEAGGVERARSVGRFVHVDGARLAASNEHRARARLELGRAARDGERRALATPNVESVHARFGSVDASRGRVDSQIRPGSDDLQNYAAAPDANDRLGPEVHEIDLRVLREAKYGVTGKPHLGACARVGPDPIARKNREVHRPRLRGRLSRPLEAQLALDVAQIGVVVRGCIGRRGEPRHHEPNEEITPPKSHPELLFFKVPGSRPRLPIVYSTPDPEPTQFLPTV
jgi:hypothetical protein